ncbi:MAG: fibronectin type III domain-containing protein [Nitrospirae bacterium]|nr:fibronectin type III domain-containing protein [Nitrospirota bacterium]
MKRTILMAGLVVGLICTLIGIVYAGEALKSTALNSAIKEAGAKWQAGETPLSSLTDQERQGRLGLIQPTLTGHERLAPLTQGATLPSSLDWRNNNGNWVTSVKDQGNCGSCWAFSTTAALESYTLRKNNTPGKDSNTPNSLDLSEQVEVSCSGAGSCNGGYINYASDFLRNTGEPVESCYAYTATNGTCSSACGSRVSSADTINSWLWVSTSTTTVDTLRNALNLYGPLVTVMAVYYDFFYYTSGIYSYVSGPYEGLHAILLVGYNDAQQYFIVKNSWGSSWGENGYYRIAYSQVTSVVGFGMATIAYPQPNITVTPASLTVKAGSSGTAAVSGGQSPYSATTANAQIATASVSGATVAITGVSAGQTTVTVKDGSGNTTTVSVTVTSVPGAPTITAVVGGNGKATISFTAPSSDGGSPITSYIVTSSTGGITATGASSPITISGLTNGISYTFTVKAINAVGTGPASAASSSVTPTSSVLGAPTGVTATAGNAQATVSFTAPASNGGNVITGYTVTSSTGGVTATGTASPITITGLTNGTAYTFTVKANIAIGSGPASSASNSVTPQASVPGAPTAVTATPGNAQAMVSFTAPASDGGSSITGYTVTSSPGGVTASATASPITVSGLTNGMAYTFTVKAINSVGSGAASSASNGVTPSATVSSVGVAVSAGIYHTAALSSDGTVWAWGQNGYGQLGNGTQTISSVSPGQVSGLTGVTAIAGGYTHTIALKGDGTVWTWGDNGYGQLGNGTTTGSYTPVQVSGLTRVTAIAGGFQHTTALNNDGTVWDWGYNGSGQLGNGTNTNTDTPVQVIFSNNGATAFYTVYPSAGANGTISPATPQSVISGKTAQFTATPNAGYYASVGGGCNGTLSGNVYTTSAITANCTVTAYFYPIIYTVTPSAGANGTISPATAQSVAYGTTKQFTVTPATGYTAAVSGCGGSLSGNIYTTGKITANCAITAAFKK